MKKPNLPSSYPDDKDMRSPDPIDKFDFLDRSEAVSIIDSIRSGLRSLDKVQSYFVLASLISLPVLMYLLEAQPEELPSDVATVEACYQAIVDFSKSSCMENRQATSHVFKNLSMISVTHTCFDQDKISKASMALVITDKDGEQTRELDYQYFNRTTTSDGKESGNLEITAYCAFSVNKSGNLSFKVPNLNSEQMLGQHRLKETPISLSDKTGRSVKGLIRLMYNYNLPLIHREQAKFDHNKRAFNIR